LFARIAGKEVFVQLAADKLESLLLEVLRFANRAVGD
jgi:hypothetical protein